MGEGLIVRRGGSSSSAKLFTEVITDNRLYTVPSTIKNYNIRVRLFGGGGGGYSGGGGGGSGYMNYAVLELAPGSQVQINIGDGGRQGATGGTSTFGGYLSAAGGIGGQANGGNGGSGGGGRKSYATLNI